MDKQIPDLELIAGMVHSGWMHGKLMKGITSRKAEDGEELMVDYEALSEPQKDQDRATVASVAAAQREVALAKLRTFFKKQACNDVNGIYREWFEQALKDPATIAATFEWADIRALLTDQELFPTIGDVYRCLGAIL